MQIGTSCFFNPRYISTTRLPTQASRRLLQSFSMATPMESALKFVDFVNSSPTPFHAVQNLKNKFLQAGFEEIRERNDWSSTCKAGGKYVLTRNASSIVAFAIGKKWKPGNSIGIIGAHTDSPTLRIKPISKSESEGFLQVGVETYGGGIWHSWFDRDLSIAGRVMVRETDGLISSRLIKVERPILRIPTLAIHLSREQKFEFSKEKQLFPIAGLAAAELNRKAPVSKEANGYGKDIPSSVSSLGPITERHHSHVVEIIANEAGVSVESILDFEIVLYDTQKSCIGGLNNELIFSPRLDNLEMTFCGATALLSSTASDDNMEDDSTIRLFAAFDNEEIGSLTAQGADSNMLPAILKRLSFISADSQNGLEAQSAFERTLSTSFLISADMAHSINPNYAGKYEQHHKPEMNKGTVIKINANARYATNSPGIVMLKEVADKAAVPLQLFVVSNESPCGSTIGPMLAGSLGIRTLDLGNPQLSMHSIRETGGVYDIDYATKLFTEFYRSYGKLEKRILID